MAPFMVLGTKFRKLLNLPGVHIRAKEKDKCISCGKCNKVCPMGIHVVDEIKSNVIDNSECIQCGACIDNCPKKSCLMEYLKERKMTIANEKRIDYVILGLLCHEELNGYEIKKRINTALKYFWSASYGSIYPALNDLVNRGLATKREDPENKRNKLIYTITDDGHKYLKEWLTLPVEKDELRYETLLKLFFGNEKGTEQAILHIEAFEEKTQKELQYLLEAKKILKACLNDDTAHKYYLLTVEFGIKTYCTYLEWCKEAKKILIDK